MVQTSLGGVKGTLGERIQTRLQTNMDLHCLRITAVFYI